MKLNIACAANMFPGWINVDRVDMSGYLATLCEVTDTSSDKACVADACSEDSLGSAAVAQGAAHHASVLSLLAGLAIARRF